MPYVWFDDTQKRILEFWVAEVKTATFEVTCL